QNLRGDAGPEVRSLGWRLREELRRVRGQLRRRGPGGERHPGRRAHRRVSARTARHPSRHSSRARSVRSSASGGTMMTGSVALPLMLAGYVGGACLALVAPSSRAARYITAFGAIVGSVAALAVAAQVLVTAQPSVLALPSVLAAAGGVLLSVDPLGAFFLAVVAIGSLPAAIYGVSYTAAYEGRSSLRLFGLMFNVFLLGMSVVACAGNIFTFVLAWELMSLASYFLVMTEADVVETREAGLWYIAMTQFSLVTLLPMFLLLAPGAE